MKANDNDEKSLSLEKLLFVILKKTLLENRSVFIFLILIHLDKKSLVIKGMRMLKEIDFLAEKLLLYLYQGNELINFWFY